MNVAFLYLISQDVWRLVRETVDSIFMCGSHIADFDSNAVLA